MYNGWKLCSRKTSSHTLLISLLDFTCLDQMEYLLDWHVCCKLYPTIELQDEGACFEGKQSPFRSRKGRTFSDDMGKPSGGMIGCWLQQNIVHHAAYSKLCVLS